MSQVPGREREAGRNSVDQAHLLIGETTGAAAAYVGMTRGRHANTAHLVAEDVTDAREQWIATFSRDRADLGPRHAAQVAADDMDRYGPQPSPSADRMHLRPPPPVPSASRLPGRTGGIGRWREVRSFR